MKRKKYDFTPEPEPEPEPKLPLFSKDDRECLARLVAKFGSQVVAHAATIVPLPEQRRRRGRGRPAKTLSLEEADNLLWFIEKYTQEAKQDCSKHPITVAPTRVPAKLPDSPLKTIKEKAVRSAAKFVAGMKKGPKW